MINPFDFKCKCTYYEGYRERHITVYPKFLKKIINKQIFTKSEITIIKQKRFYTSYCYAHGISYNNVVKNWNKPFDKVLVRDNDKGRLDIHFYEGYNNENKSYPYRTLGGMIYKQCIPYKGNEHLTGLVKDCSDYYKTW